MTSKKKHSWRKHVSRLADAFEKALSESEQQDCPNAKSSFLVIAANYAGLIGKIIYENDSFWKPGHEKRAREINKWYSLAREYQTLADKTYHPMNKFRRRKREAYLELYSGEMNVSNFVERSFCWALTRFNEMSSDEHRAICLKNAASDANSAGILLEREGRFCAANKWYCKALDYISTAEGFSPGRELNYRSNYERRIKEVHNKRLLAVGKYIGRRQARSSTKYSSSVIGYCGDSFTV